jgi:hypothetical protein
LFITHRVQQNRKALSGEEGRVEERRIWIENNVLQQSNWIRQSNSDTLRKKQRKTAIWLGSQDSWGGVKTTCVDLRSVRAVRLNLWKSRGVTEQRLYTGIQQTVVRQGRKERRKMRMKKKT